MRSAAEFVLARDRFGIRPGLARIRALLARLGDPQRSFRAVHVVGTNGKTTTTRMVEALLADAGLATGAYVSPHVVRFAERIRVRGEEADLDRLVAGIVPAIEAVDRELGDPVTQFEVLTAAAFVAFAEAGVEAAAVEAGLGGRRDATNVLAAPVVVLTSVGLDHTDHLGETRELIAREKLAVVRPGAVVVLGEPEWERLARESGASRVVPARGNLGCAVAAAEAFLGRAADPAPAERVRVPGRLELVARDPLELWDGAHNAEGARYLAGQLAEAGPFVLVSSVLADKDAEGILRPLAARATALVATSSTSARSRPAAELAALARERGLFRHVEAVADPVAARARARELAGPAGVVVVAGSLYLLVDLAAVRPGRVP
ncbi:MAG: bifunctional folylpolyglutamate synthase/dihydrofolate synthase [Thermoleophilia bacterium]|nr:bifunctional folylpolyglutamate synthase/dihydrofolate synthase [Thermoleophilia bacterium]